VADRTLVLLLAAAALALPLVARAQERAPARPQTERLFIEHADQVQRLAQGDSVSYYLDGNVRARRGDLRLTAEHVVILDWLGIADFSRSVHAWDEENELYADHATYTDSTDVILANGNVQVIDRKSGSQLKSQQAVYDRDAGVLTATQKPEMLILPEPAEAAVPDSAPADSAAEPIHVWSRQVELYRESDDVLATGDVLVRRGEDLTAKADTVRFARSADQVLLRGKPRVETDRFYIEGREIDVRLPDEKLEALLARGDARASSRSDSIPAGAIEALGSASANSWISGDSLRIAFRDELVQTLFAEGGARSLNYSLESRAGDAATWALSYLLAGSIRLVFDDAGEGLERLEASKDGRGVYRTAALTGAEPDTAKVVAPDSAGVAARDTIAADSAAIAGRGRAVASPDSSRIAPAGDANAAASDSIAAGRPRPEEPNRAPARADSSAAEPAEPAVTAPDRPRAEGGP
jgi:lipopolysaccharide export system protein LptA